LLSAQKSHIFVEQNCCAVLRDFRQVRWSGVCAKIEWFFLKKTKKCDEMDVFLLIELVFFRKNGLYVVEKVKTL